MDNKLWRVILGCTICGCGATGTTQRDAGLTFAEFKSLVVQEETGEFIADGDTLIVGEAELRAFYDGALSEDPVATSSDALIIMNVNGKDAKWSAPEAINISYCVSRAFGSHYSDVVDAMGDAAADWAEIANVKFVYLSKYDSTCSRTNKSVVFDVSPVDANGSYLARAFFPTTARSSRNVKIDESAFTTSGEPTLRGILRHELGHTLGFRHEHTRPEAGKCFEDKRWRPLTPYDKASVMHYPQCNGTGSFALEFTARDRKGASLVYPK